MTTDRFKDGIQWWMDTKTYGAYPNPPQWHIDTGNLVRLVPQRPWVGLTVQERNDCLVQADPCECLADPEAHQLMVEVEAKLRSKNT